jgi:hypothetical protein
MHLALVADPPDAAHDSPKSTADIDSAILAALDRAQSHGLARDSLRSSLRVRNQRLGQALSRLAASGHIVQHGDTWLRLPLPVPTPIHTSRNRNGNAALTEAQQPVTGGR